MSDREHNNELLRTACILGKYDKVKALLKKKEVDIDYADADGSTALYHAAHQNYRKITKILLDYGADPFIKNDRGMLPHQNISKSIQQVFDDYYNPDKATGFFGIFGASIRPESWPTSRIGFAKGAGASLRRSGSHSSSEETTSRTNSPLPTPSTTPAGSTKADTANASRRSAPAAAGSAGSSSKTTGDPAASRTAKSANYTAVSPSRGAAATTTTTAAAPTAASTAAASTAAAGTVQEGLSVDVLGKMLWDAANQNQLDRIRELIDKKSADINWANGNGETPLLQACYAGKLEAAKLLLSRGARLNIPEKDGWTALHWASRKGHAAIVDELLRQGADPSLPNKIKQTPYMLAASQDIKDIFKTHHANIKYSSSRKSKSTSTATTSTTTTSSSSTAAAAPKAEVCDEAKLFAAVRTNQHDVFTTLLNSNSINLNWRSQEGQTALIAACARELSTLAIALIDKGASIDAADKTGMTALHWASKKGFCAVVQLLLNRGADCKKTNMFDQTPLECAKNGEVKEVFLNYSKQHKHKEPISTEARLFSAVKSNQSDTVDQLLSKPGINVDSLDGSGQTSLMLASARDLVKVAAILMSKGANIDLADSNGMTALHWASMKGSCGAVQLLLNKGADYRILNMAGKAAMDCAKNAATSVIFKRFSSKFPYSRPSSTQSTATRTSSVPKGPSPAKSVQPSTTNTTMGLGESLYRAVDEGNIEQVRAVLDQKGVDINWKNQSNETALIQAAYKGHTAVVELLVERGAHLDDQEKDGWSALHWAAHRGNVNMVKLLLQRGANRKLQKKNGTTAEQIATKPSIRDLFRSIPIPSSPAAATNNNKSETSEKSGDSDPSLQLYKAAEVGDLELVKKLLPRAGDGGGVNINYRFEGSDTPLIAACCEGHIEVAKVLIENDADVNIIDESGWSSLYWASYFGYGPLVTLLIEHGADETIVSKKGKTASEGATSAEIKALIAAEVEKRRVNRLKQNQSERLPQPVPPSTKATKSAAFTPPLSPTSPTPHVDTNVPSLQNDGNDQNDPVLPTGGSRIDLLFAAAGRGDLATVNALLPSIEVTQIDNPPPDKDGQTSLMRAAECGHTEVIEALLDMGADPNLQQDKTGRSALHWACVGAHQEAVTTLLQRGADTYALDKSGSTPDALCSSNAAIMCIFEEYEDLLQPVLPPGGDCADADCDDKPM